jgi:SPP1 gp7 family putative phage head morphogenesis protein
MTKVEQTAFDLLIKNEAKYSAAVATQWRKALEHIQNDMKIIYKKYAKDKILSKAMMTQYNRYAEMEKIIMKRLNIPIEATKETIKRLLPVQYNEAFFHYAWAIDQDNKVRLNWGTINKNAPMEITKSPFLKISLTKYGPLARETVRKALLDGLTVGKSYEKMARDLRDAINADNYKAMRIIRTEGQTALNAGQNDAYLKAEEQGIEGGEVWDATLDGRTRPTHAAMDGQKKNRETNKFDGPGGENAEYPGDPNLSAGERINCRCRIAFEVDGYSPQLRRTRAEGLIPYQTYSEWLNETASIDDKMKKKLRQGILEAKVKMMGVKEL